MVSKKQIGQRMLIPRGYLRNKLIDNNIIMIIINHNTDICTECGLAFKHKRKHFKLLGDELKTVFFITCHERCCKELKYKTLKNLIYTFFLEKKIRVVDLEDRQ